ncbi:MAG: DUF2490 domain-containing protein [Pseudomonadota bacterium]
MKTYLKALACLAATALSAPAIAQEEDLNVWGGQFIFVDLDEDGDWYARGEAQERFTNDADRLGQLLLRSFIGYRISKDVDVGGGYAFILTDPVGPVEINEHRIYQEVNVTLLENEAGLKVTSRNRFEQRFFEEDGETALRYRNLVQVTAPITDSNNLVLYSEPFIGINETPLQRGGLGLWRNFAGVSIPVADGFTFTPGYLNQYVFRDGEDRMDHVINLGLTARF